MPKVTGSPREHAVRIGNGVHKWVDSKTASGSKQTLTDATLYQNIAANQRLYITAMHFNLETVSDDCCFNLVKCAAVAGGGAAVEIAGCAHIFTGGTMATGVAKERPYDPPILVEYGTGALSVSIQINANDASAVVSCGFSGYLVVDDPRV